MIAHRFTLTQIQVDQRGKPPWPAILTWTDLHMDGALAARTRKEHRLVDQEHLNHILMLANGWWCTPLPPTRGAETAPLDAMPG